MAKKRMPIYYGIIGNFREFLAYNLTKYQYFSMRPILFDFYYQITYPMQVSAEYKIVDLMAQNHQKLWRHFCAKIIRADKFTH